MLVAFGEGSSRLMAEFVESPTAVDGSASLARACSSSLLGVASCFVSRGSSSGGLGSSFNNGCSSSFVNGGCRLTDTCSSFSDAGWDPSKGIDGVGKSL